MRFPIRGHLAAILSLAFLLASASSGRAACGSDPGDPARLLGAQAAVDSQCDCCGAPGRAQYIRCVARVAKAAVHAGTLRRACKSIVVRRAASLPCPLRAASGATSTPNPVCRICNSDADCETNEFCECRPGTCSPTGGTCVVRPAVCFDLVAPVCGCDGNTYANDCERRVAGVCKRASGPCEAGQCFDTIQLQCTGQSCSPTRRCPLPNEFCVPVCPPPLPTGTCFDPAGGRCTDQSCSPSTPCPPNEFCLAQCPPPTDMCFDTVTRQCTDQACSPTQPCSFPNEFCTPRCPPPPPPSTTTTTLPGQMCQTDADCDDGNGCTHDACVNGACVHVCICLSPEGALTCCPGPAALCVRPCGSDAAGACGGTCPSGASCESLPGATTCGCVSGVGGPCGGNLFVPPPVCAAGLVCQQTNPDATGVCVTTTTTTMPCIPFFQSGCSVTSDCCQPCGAGIIAPCAVCLQGQCVGAP